MTMRGNKPSIVFVNSDSLSYIRDKVPDDSVQMIYLDPPFFKQKHLYQYSKADQKVHTFSDKWESLEKYQVFIESVLVECRKKLKSSGLIFLHCDTSANHHLRMSLDKIFHEEMFVNEVVWVYKRWSNSSNKLLDAHQTIWIYSKTDRYKFNKIMTSYSPTTNVDQILQMRSRNENNIVVYKRDESNEIIGTTEKNGVPLRDVWEIPFLNPKAKERVGYPTQKPVELLKRIIQISCDEGDLVLDPFCGSGSMGIASILLGCDYIGIDNNSDAIKICEKRKKDYFVSKSEVIDGNYRAFNNLEKEIRDFLNEIDAIPVERNRGIDGIFSSDEGLVGIRFQRENESLLDTISWIKKATYDKPLFKRVVVKTHDSDLFDLEQNDVLIIESLQYKFKKLLRGNAPILRSIIG